jgi:hypothetical protein
MRFGLGAILVRVSVHNHVLQPFIAVGRDKRSLNKGTHRTTLKGSESQHRRGSDLREERLREVTERKNRKKMEDDGEGRSRKVGTLRTHASRGARCTIGK